MRSQKIIAFFLLVVLVLTACAKPEQPNDSAEVENNLQTQAPVDEISPFYTAVMESDVRPVAVMIDNDDKTARPQVGLEDAYAVYEAVVEGKATRMMALFKGNEPEKVGPVRSSRHYFLDFALEHDAIYAHAGWSPKAQSDMKALGVNNINGIQGGDGTCFWRDNTYNSTWHNLYTSISKLRGYAETTKKYKQTSDRHPLPFQKKEQPLAAGSAATSVSLPYASFYQLTYRYNAETGLYERSINGSPHTSQRGGVFSAKNILILPMKNTMLADAENKGRQDLATVGTGKGYYVTGGVSIPITWSKKSRSSSTVYQTETGEALYLNPGQTWIQIVPTDMKYTIE